MDMSTDAMLQGPAICLQLYFFHGFRLFPSGRDIRAHILLPAPLFIQLSRQFRFSFRPLFAHFSAFIFFGYVYLDHGWIPQG